MAAPEFTVTFIIDGNWQRYSDFIHDLRGRVADPNAPLCRGLLQLPIENPNLAQCRQRWFAVVLQVGANRLTLRIRRENLYLDAYQTMDGRWYEYNSKSPRLYPDSVILYKINGSYPQVENDFARRASIALTLHTFTDAVNDLAGGVSEKNDSRRHQLVLIQMISESIRLQSITQYLVAGHGIGGAPSWMIGREDCWSKLSRLLIAIVADPSQPFEMTEILRDETQVWSDQDLTNAFGILKPPSEERGMAADSNDFDDFGGGPKVEVFGVRINRSVAMLSGTVTGKDAFTHSIYDRKSTNPEAVEAWGFPLLTGQIVEPVSACDSFIIDVDLWSYEKSNFQVSKGTIEWNPYNLGSGEYDRFIQHDFSGDGGRSATVQYVVFSDAVRANIEVILINGDGEDPANVYGDILAVNNKVIEGESVLFRKGKNGRIDVRPGEEIPLSRSIVAVPINGNLHVRVDLWDYDYISADDQIAKGTAIFKSKRYGTDTQKITGEYGEIQVNVTWRI